MQLFSVIALAAAVALSCAKVDMADFFPFGKTAGDKQVEPSDDGSSPMITISKPFHFFGESSRHLWVNTNGGVSFNSDISKFTPTCDPVPAKYSMISPYWADINTLDYKPSRVYHRESRKTSDLEKCTGEVKRAFPDLQNINIKWSYIATWYRVSFHEVKQKDRTPDEGPVPENTFQLALASDGTRSFAIFYYNNITWTTGRESGGDKVNGLGGDPARAGFDSGDGENVHNINGSCTGDIINIASKSNVESSGTFIFRVDNHVIETPAHPAVQTTSPKGVEASAIPVVKTSSDQLVKTTPHPVKTSNPQHFVTPAPSIEVCSAHGHCTCDPGYEGHDCGSQEPGCPPGFTAARDEMTCYKFNDVIKNHDDAKALCASQSGSILPLFYSQKEIDDMRATLAVHDEIHLGARVFKDAGVWIPEKPDYCTPWIPWDIDQPANGPHRCAVMHTTNKVHYYPCGDATTAKIVCQVRHWGQDRERKCPTGFGKTASGSACYKLTNVETSHANAHALCAAQGGSVLPMFRSAKDLDEFRATLSVSGKFHLGTNSIVKEEVWIMEKPECCSSHLSWDAGQPSKSMHRCSTLQSNDLMHAHRCGTTSSAKVLCQIRLRKEDECQQ